MQPITEHNNKQENKEKQEMPNINNIESMILDMLGGGYPHNVEDVVKPMKFKQATKQAMHDFKFARPWRGTIEERKTKFSALIDTFNHIYLPDNPVTISYTGLDGDTEANRGNGSYNRQTHRIEIKDKLSVVTLLHEFAHAMGKDEMGASTWSINLYRIWFPRLFAGMERHGHLLVQPTPTPETEEVI